MVNNGKHALRRAIAIIGSQAALARAVGVSQPGINRMLHRGKRVPAEWCLPIERATRGLVTRHDLRSDVYPVEDKVEAAQ